jgi:hypothetical protein
MIQHICRRQTKAFILEQLFSVALSIIPNYISQYKVSSS